MKRRLPLLLPLLTLFAFPRVAAAAGCQLVLGFQTMSALVDVGACLDDQGTQPNGDATQHTTRGLLVWRKADNWTAFTDGYRTWIIGPFGLQSRLSTERFDWETVAASSPTASPAAPVAMGEVKDPRGNIATSCQNWDVIYPFGLTLVGPVYNCSGYPGFEKVQTYWTGPPGRYWE